MVIWFRCFIKDYAEITDPLVLLTGKHFVLKSRSKKAWSNEQHDAINRIKPTPSSAPVLHFPDFSREFVADTDVSGVGAGGFFAQPSTDLEIIAYYSHRFSKNRRPRTV